MPYIYDLFFTTKEKGAWGEDNYCKSERSRGAGEDTVAFLNQLISIVQKSHTITVALLHFKY